ncbi:hypothetical protein U2718_005940 [Chlorogloeopsis sp. ULAP02]
MKCLLLNLFAMITLFGVNATAYANPANIPTVRSSSDRAASLVTQPVTINSSWGNVIYRNNNLQQSGRSISVIRQQECQNIIELITDPARILKECENKKNNQTPQNTQQIDYFKPPKQLDSGVNVTVTQF